MSEPVPHSTLREYLEAFLIALLFLGFTNTFVAKTVFIPSGSMETTLLVGDHLFVNRAIYGAAATGVERALLPLRAPRRGDIVVFRSPQDPTVDVVKRLIGLPGDTVAIVEKHLFVNGARVDDGAYARHVDPAVLRPGTGAGDPRRDNFGPYRVPEGHYFCLGDNRDNSYDSRFWGPLPARYLKGRASIVYWSFGGGTSDGQWHGFGAKLRQVARTVAGFVTETRWLRTLHLPR